MMFWRIVVGIAIAVVLLCFAVLVNLQVCDSRQAAGLIHNGDRCGMFYLKERAK